MADPGKFLFRDLQPNVLIGTASDRYAGWIGQIYSPDRYAGRITRRAKKLGDGSFTEEVLPVESVSEYFDHFPVLEIDYTFYRPLLDASLRPTESHHALSRYREQLRPGDRLVLKVPQAVVAPRLRRGGGFAPNPDYLDADLFSRRFLEPASAILGDHLAGMVFEQEYLPKGDRIPPAEMAAGLDAFFGAIPKDTRYHAELRTEAFLSPPVFDVFEKHGVGQVLSHWTWLPPLTAQHRLSGGRFLNAGGGVIMRLMTPLRTRYEEAYAKAHPFNRMVEGMMSPGMVGDVVAIAREATAKGRLVMIIVNNRAGGNAPLIAREIALRLTTAPAFS